MSEARKALHRLAERDRGRAADRVLRDVARCSCPPDTYSPDGYPIFTPSAACPVHGDRGYADDLPGLILDMSGQVIRDGYIQ